jgi:Tfp pilus assembly protein PilV
MREREPMNTNSHDQRGIAMMIVLFALLLLSVVGLGMMYSTNMETAINGNYRDKQNAFYAALAGLQEGRERIRVTGADASGNPVYGNGVTPPTVLPSTLTQNVIYIVSNASTVIPWNTTTASGSGYKYFFDTEFCHDNVIYSSLGAAGVPCDGVNPSIPSGTWWQLFDDSTAGSPWNSGAALLDWKWTRITLKSNNMTSVAVNGTTTDYSQTCWNGTNEISTPYPGSTGCKPKGGVTAILMLNTGNGYTSTPPTVTIGGDGSGATATAHVTATSTGEVTLVTLTTGGSGYTSSPTVTITGDGTGSGTTALAILSSTGTTTTTSNTVSSVTLSNNGSGYTGTGPTISFSGGGGSGATAYAILNSSGTTVTSGYVSSITLGSAGSGYTSAPSVGFNGGSGTGALATATLGTSGTVIAVSVTSPGTQCYSANSDVVVTFSAPSAGGTTATGTGAVEASKSCIYSVSVSGAGDCQVMLDTSHGYGGSTPTSSPTTDKMVGVTFSQKGNYSFSGTLNVTSSNNKTPTSVTVQNPGYDASNYNAGFTSVLEIYNNGTSTSQWPKHCTNNANGCTAVEDCNNSSFTATAGYRLSSITLTNAGSGYTAAPTITVTGGVGSTSYPTATATLGFPVASLTLTNGGSGYLTAPTVSFTATTGSGATATAAVVETSSTTYALQSVKVTAGGTGYTSAPTVTFTATTGSGAQGMANITANATVTTYPVQSVNICNTAASCGTGWTTASISFSGGGGSGAAATATITSVSTGDYFVDSIAVNNQGSGYTYNPPITIAAPTGSSPVTATATSQISGGTKFGYVWVLTSLAQTKTGARSMLQMEIASPVVNFSPGGALTLDGPNPHIDALPNSGVFTVKGNDANSCNDTNPDSAHPAIDGYDDPSHPNTGTSSVQTILNAIPSGRTGDYSGTGSSPSVQNGFASLGPLMTTPDGLSSLIQGIQAKAPNPNSTSGGVYGGVGGYSGTAGTINFTESNIALGSCPNTGTSQNPIYNSASSSCHTVIDVVQGNLDLGGGGGGAVGFGILVVEGTLTMHGSFSWYGPIFVVGDGVFNYSGGGTGQIQGNLFVSKVWNGDGVTYPDWAAKIGSLADPDAGSPTIHWNGGGGNGIQFDHCWSEKLMSVVTTTYQPTDSYKVLSFRILPY